MQDTTTNTENALAVRTREEALANNPALAAQTNAIEVLKQKAMILLESGMLPESIKKWQQAAAIMMRAEELEVDYWTGLMHLFAVKGSPQPDGQLSLALVQRSGLMERYEILETTDEVCKVRLKRLGQPVFEFTCTYAEYSKLAQSGAEKQKRTHLRWYTIKGGLRAIFSDVLNNMQRKRGQQVIFETDLPNDLPDDDVFVVEEGDFREGEAAQPSAPLSLSPSAAPEVSSADDGSDEARTSFADDDALLQKLADLSASEDAAAEGTADIPAVGALNMNSLLERALKAKLAKNEFHFGNLLALLLKDGSITERMTADQVLDAMKRHKAAKELRGEADSVPEQA